MFRQSTAAAVVGLISVLTQPAFTEETGKLEAKAMLVAADLSVKPVPKKTFKVDCQGEACATHTVVTTSFGGDVTLDLPPGQYVMTTVEAVEFEGQRYSWSIPFEIHAGATVRLELSNDNASVEKAEHGGPVLTEGALFGKVKRSVFKVISEEGTGSGFLVDDSGLVLTNHHVVRDSSYLAVKVDEKRKYPAVLVGEDPANDIAVLRISSKAIEGVEPLALAADSAEKPPVAVGERVVAVGSPLGTENILTSGLVSKIEEGAILSDVSINPGNSGGPLFNMLGEVVGINTFGLGSRGPGVAGIVRIHLALPVVEKARAASEQSAPPDRLLPEASTFRFPPQALKEAAMAAPPPPSAYHVDLGRLDIQFMTPTLIASLQATSERTAAEGRNKRTRGKGMGYAPGTDYYEWQRYAGEYRPVVVVQAIPEIALTGGSIVALLMLGPNVPQNFRFKTDFEKMELLRDGVVIEPIHPGRAPQVRDIKQGYVSMHDVAYFGSYEYPPEAFKPNGKVVLRVWEQGRPEPRERAISGVQLIQIYNDFLPYFQALEEATRNAPDSP